MEEQKNIAIVGAGVSGLTAAYELNRAGHEVTIFEAGDYAGGHTNTVIAPDQDEGGRLLDAHPVDTGFIVFNERNYPNFERLLADLGVESQPAPMSFSVSDGDGSFEWAATPRGLFAQRSNLFSGEFWRMLREFRRFNREMRALFDQADVGGPSLREFLTDGGYSDYFVERLIVPQVAAVWSADPDQLWSFPAAFIARFFENHGQLQILRRPKWRTVTGGSKTYVEALLEAIGQERIKLSSPIRSIERFPDRVELRWQGSMGVFDHVVIATHSDQALGLLADPSQAEQEILGAIPYQANQAVLHTDTSIMPKRRAAWSSWNYHLTDDVDGLTKLTYDMNILQSIESRQEFLVTLNRTEAIDPKTIIAKIDYAHPVYTEEGMIAQGRWSAISNEVARTSYAGAYWRWGFHEDGVWSALRAVEALGIGARGPLADKAEGMKGSALAPIPEAAASKPEPTLELGTKSRDDDEEREPVGASL